MRAVLDPNVIVSALISPRGAPADILRAWRNGEFELTVSPALLAELERVFAYPKLRGRVERFEGMALIHWLARAAIVVDDGLTIDDRLSSLRSADPGDDYLLGLAANAKAMLVSGDKHLLALAGDAPIYRPAEFLQLLRSATRGRSRPERA